MSEKLYRLDVFTDGSDLGKVDRTDKVRSGAVIVVKEDVVFKLSKSVNVKEFRKKYKVRPSNPYAELYAVRELLKSLVRHKHIHDVIFTIYSDYEGVQKWLNGSWKAKKPYIKELVDDIYEMYFELNSRNVRFVYKWVKGHQNVDSYQKRMNDLADEVAKDENEYDEIQNLFSWRNRGR